MSARRLVSDGMIMALARDDGVEAVDHDPVHGPGFLPTWPRGAAQAG